MERRLADIPTEEWGDVTVDITPRELTLTYLSHSFPTQLFEEYTDSDGNLASRPVLRDGQPVQCRDAVQRRDRLIERLASLDPVPGALDQIVQHFGADRQRPRQGAAAVDPGHHQPRRAAPDRRCSAEHPFGTMKRMMTGRFLTRGLKGTRAEMALSVLAYNMIRHANLAGS
jgi:hypothetical protein